MKKLTTIAATAAPAILLLAVSSTSWASCSDVGGEHPPTCETGIVHVLAASEQCFKVRMPSGTSYAIDYRQSPDALATIGQMQLLRDGALVTILTNGTVGGPSGPCPGNVYIDKPVRAADYP